MRKMGIAFFGAKKYERGFFDDINEDFEIKYFGVRLTTETAHHAAGYDAVCIFVNDDASEPVLQILNKCKVGLILLRCAGYNNVDLKATKKYNITVLRVPAYSPYAVAEHAMTILQTANRRVHKAYSRVRDNNFALDGLMGVDLNGKTAGIVGTGKIGICMARICKGYGMKVIAWDAFPNRDYENSGLLTYVSRSELWIRSDLISLHAPLVMGEGGTYHLINSESIALMKDSVMLVNTSRGGLVDTEALIEAMKRGKFHAVALDVYEGEDQNVFTDYSDEPICNDITARLLSFPNLVLTSHQAFFTEEAMRNIAAVTMTNAMNYHRHLDLGDALVNQ